jgi:hypothetical protein
MKGTFGPIVKSQGRSDDKSFGAIWVYGNQSYGLTYEVIFIPYRDTAPAKPMWMKDLKQSFREI